MARFFFNYVDQASSFFAARIAGNTQARDGSQNPEKIARQSLQRESSKRKQQVAHIIKKIKQHPLQQHLLHHRTKHKKPFNYRLVFFRGNSCVKRINIVIGKNRNFFLHEDFSRVTACINKMNSATAFRFAAF